MEVKLGAFTSVIAIELMENCQGAMGRVQSRCIECTIFGRPHCQEGVTGKTNHFAIVLCDDLDEPAEISIEEIGELFRPDGPLMRQSFGQRREAGDLYE